MHSSVSTSDLTHFPLVIILISTCTSLPFHTTFKAPCRPQKTPIPGTKMLMFSRRLGLGQWKMEARPLLAYPKDKKPLSKSGTTSGTTRHANITAQRQVTEAAENSSHSRRITKLPPVRLVVQSMSFRNHNLPSLLMRAWWYRDSKRTNLNPCMRTKVQGPALTNRPWPTGAEANTSANGSLDFHTRQLDRFLSTCPECDPWRGMNAEPSQEGPTSVIGKPKCSRSSSRSSLLAEHGSDMGDEE